MNVDADAKANRAHSLPIVYIIANANELSARSTAVLPYCDARGRTVNVCLPLVCIHVSLSHALTELKSCPRNLLAPIQGSLSRPAMVSIAYRISNMDDKWDAVLDDFAPSSIPELDMESRDAHCYLYQLCHSVYYRSCRIWLTQGTLSSIRKTSSGMYFQRIPPALVVQRVTHSLNSPRSIIWKTYLQAYQPRRDLYSTQTVRHIHKEPIKLDPMPWMANPVNPTSRVH